MVYFRLSSLLCSLSFILFHPTCILFFSFFFARAFIQQWPCNNKVTIVINIIFFSCYSRFTLIAQFFHDEIPSVFSLIHPHIYSLTYLFIHSSFICSHLLFSFSPDTKLIVALILSLRRVCKINCLNNNNLNININAMSHEFLQSILYSYSLFILDLFFISSSMNATTMSSLVSGISPPFVDLTN